jgi:DDE superfamily endonuclease
VTKALCSVAPQYLKWPDEEEKQQIGKEMLQKYGFPHCVMIADGTLFPLAFEPQTDDAPDYSGRKSGYSLSTMICCDHNRRIRHYLAGYPGSAHENRVYNATRFAKQPSTDYSPREYCIGENIPRSHQQFNNKLAKVRIVSEHCIDILKGRFPWLVTY